MNAPQLRLVCLIDDSRMQELLFKIWVNKVFDSEAIILQGVRVESQHHKADILLMTVKWINCKRYSFNEEGDHHHEMKKGWDIIKFHSFSKNVKVPHDSLSINTSVAKKH